MNSSRLRFSLRRTASLTFGLALLGACADGGDLTGGGGSSSSSEGGRGEDGTRDGGGGSASNFGGNSNLGGQAECGDTELCGDNVDNNCDGATDEDCECDPGELRECYTGDMAVAGIGACVRGSQDCDEFGKWSAICQGEVLPSDETCDGEDNDCDGAVDDGFGDISCGQGLCMVTVPACENGAPVECVPLDPEDPVEDCEGEDDDCDGTADEGCLCETGETQPCYSGPAGTTGVGICAAGTQTCTNGQWGNCVGEVTPGTESCDALDQDCDGNANEGSCSLPNATSTCSGGGCNISSCNTGWDHCDNSIPNGCELQHSGASNTAPGQNLGDFAADAAYGFGCASDGCEGPIVTQTGTRGKFFNISALEDSSCCAYVSLRFELVVPPGVDYDLHVTGNACMADPGFQSLNGAGLNEVITVWCEDDCGGGDTGFDAGIEVRYYGGHSCDPWTLNVYRREC